ncbi:MAG TPA: YdeI/OmpD-associated family protein [Bacteroidales bacterium]|nr:YdeI/OmpD-associated family protein [Bacteroidales bacterium]HSA44652.1 YdeI/OmpD-associated family protein [Bacteroidales bacterium]
MDPNKTSEISNGILHEVPEDMKSALASNPAVLMKWNQLTPIQRNEWICWVTTVKKTVTRAEHIDRMLEELNEGKRQPCCWPGCPHRRPNAEKWFKQNLSENAK